MRITVNTEKADVTVETERGKLLSTDGALLYEGYLYKGKPCGDGVSYYENGNKFQEGHFGIKGLLSGKEYYPDGHLRFEGLFRLNKAYGPNAPVSGSYYDREGNLVYQGNFKLRFGGVGYPSVVIPETYGPIPQSARPEELEYLMWNDVIEQDNDR